MPRCEWLVTARFYSKPGRCQIKYNVQSVVFAKDKKPMTANLCVRHRKMADHVPPVILAR